MDIASILLILAVAVLVAMYVSRPFFSRTPVVKTVDADPRERELSALLAAGAEVYRKLDEMEETAPAASAEDRLEAAVAARRADAVRTGQAPIPPRPSDDLEARIAARRSQRQEKSAGFCPGCGNPVQKSDRFCPRCGKTL